MSATRPSTAAYKSAALLFHSVFHTVRVFIVGFLGCALPLHVSHKALNSSRQSLQPFCLTLYSTLCVCVLGCSSCALPLPFLPKTHNSSKHSCSSSRQLQSWLSSPAVTVLSLQRRKKAKVGLMSVQNPPCNCTVGDGMHFESKRMRDWALCNLFPSL